ncbi:unnamed protein product [Blumeria hordei]|uniref:Phosphoinositide phospholipase C n=2 Tax=Blumeria hordei TaxID=2867405 RepID=A0A383UW93_BLUHO|nr:phosphoinositide-specific phospholipase C [Blumeria hordei DH14]SZF04591.1 unnamed protein product [Blumeria hordei]
MLSQQHPTTPSLATSMYPRKIQTCFPTNDNSAASPVTASVVSASSVVTTSSPQVSPIISPSSAQLLTNNTSIQGSPDGAGSRDDDFHLIPFELSDPITASKASHNAMTEAVAYTKSPGIIRRLSNRASQLASSRRRPSTNAIKRDCSGPVIMRRRSDSTSAASDGYKGVLFTDSDEDIEADFKLDGTNGIEGSRDFLNRTMSSGSASCPPPLSTAAGPVIPSILLQGTVMMKVSRKKKFKPLTLVLENDEAKVTWDKNRPSKSFYIDDIKDIRAGVDARNYRQEFGVSPEDESKFFSIVYAVPDKSKGRAQKIMHLIAHDEQTFDSWTSTLDAISKHRHELMASLSSFHEKAVKQYWRTEMNRKFHNRPHLKEDEKIDFVGVERLCKSLHINGSSSYLNSRFSQADISGSGRLNFSEFQEFVRLMKRREDVRAIYREIASDPEKGITVDDFFKFLYHTQGEPVDADRTHWEGVFAKFVRRSKTRDQAHQQTCQTSVSYMNESALSSFLISTLNVPMHTQPSSFTLNRPLNEYFISSSHNTYLLGRQVAGQSSIEAYISVLSRGCRCVEIDCWNGSEGPVVMHGRTLTSQVSFVDVMSTVSKYAFVKSPFPLFISLEVHCNPPQQAMMVEIIKATCGKKLVTAPIDPSAEKLPTPSQLLNRILIKVRKPRTLDESTYPESTRLDTRLGRNRGNSLNSPYTRPTQLDNSTVSAGLLPPTSYPRANLMINQTQLRNQGSECLDNLSTSTSDSEGLTEDTIRARENVRVSKTSNIIKELGELGVYTRGIGFSGYDSPECKTYNHIFSFMESTFNKNSRTPEDKHAIVRHNIQYLMRVYPNGWRVASTNFDPLKYWRRGVQMLALNWQTYDLGMQLNEAMFASGTDCSGYVLKPIELRDAKYLQSEKPGDGRVKRERKNVTFSIDVISAQQLMRPKNLAQNRSVDPYVEVEVYHADDKSKENKGVVGVGGLDASGKDGFSSLGVPHRRRTHIITENGFNPIFNKKFRFSLTTKYPDLVFIRWTVRYSSDGHNYNEKGAPLAIYTAKLNSLKQGYRTLPLYDSNGDQFLFSTLFCRINIKPVTSIYVNDPGSDVGETVGVLKTIGRSVFNRNPI